MPAIPAIKYGYLISPHQELLQPELKVADCLDQVSSEEDGPHVIFDEYVFVGRVEVRIGVTNAPPPEMPGMSKVPHSWYMGPPPAEDGYTTGSAPKMSRATEMLAWTQGWST